MCADLEEPGLFCLTKVESQCYCSPLIHCRIKFILGKDKPKKAEEPKGTNRSEINLARSSR